MLVVAAGARIWLTGKIAAPWIMGDELEYSELAKSFESSRNYLLRLMSQCQTGKNRMKALLPGVPVEHKTGTLDGLTDDVGFITMPDGHRIAVAIFARGGTNRPRTIAEAARAIYDGFTRVVTWPFTAPAAAFSGN
jgi:beta-lactamase class A